MFIIHLFTDAYQDVGSLWQYLKDRLTEKSTYASIIVSISVAAVMPSPYSYLSLVCGVIGVLVPTKVSA